MLASIFCRERYFTKAGASKKRFEDTVDMGTREAYSVRESW